MKVRGIDFVVYYVSNMQRAIEFYRDTLGLPLDYEPKGNRVESSVGWVEIPIEPVTLALCGFAGLQPSQQSSQGAATVALAVEDIKAAIADLRGKGIAVEGPDESEVCYMAWFKDPDGNELMLHQRKDGTWG